MTSLAAVTQERLVFAATAVGVFRSHDSGSHWELPASTLTVPLAAAIAVSPDAYRDRTLFACGEDGLYRSTDLAASWSRVLIGNGMLCVLAVIADPDRAPVVIVGTEADGILRSDDGGRTWNGASAGLTDLTAMSLAASPRFASDHTAFAGTASGLYRTRNAARSWRLVDAGLDDVAVQALLAPTGFADDQLVLAGTERHGLLRSVDGGWSWESPPTLASGGVIALAGANGLLAAATDTGMFLSHDEGLTWRAADMGPTEAILSVVFSGTAMLAGLHRRGLIRSVDGGGTWQPVGEGLSARLDTRLVLSADFGRDQTLFVGGREDGVRVSSDGGVSWEERKINSAEAVLNDLCVNTGGLWAAGSNGLYFTRDRANSWSRARVGAARFVGAASTTVAAVFEPGHLVLSEDDGTTWTDVRLPTEHSSIVGVAVTQDGSLLVATAAATELTVWRWDDHRSWSRVLVETGSPEVPVALAASTRTVLLGVGDRVVQEGRSVTLGSETVHVTSLAAAPDGHVFAATNAGVFLSRDGGQTFADWSDGLINPRTLSIAVSPTYPEDRLVYALSLGGAVWRRMGC